MPYTSGDYDEENTQLELDEFLRDHQERLDSSNRQAADQALRNGTPERVGGRIVFNKTGQMVAQMPRIVENIKDRPYSQVRAERDAPKSKPANIPQAMLDAPPLPYTKPTKADTVAGVEVSPDEFDAMIRNQDDIERGKAIMGPEGTAKWQEANARSNFEKTATGPNSYNFDYLDEDGNLTPEGEANYLKQKTLRAFEKTAILKPDGTTSYNLDQVDAEGNYTGPSTKQKALATKLDKSKELGMTAAPKEWKSSTQLDSNTIQSYTQDRLDSDPTISATKILRGLKQEFGKEALEPEVSLTIRQYLANPHSLSAPGLIEPIASGIASSVEGLGQTLMGAVSGVGDLFGMESETLNKGIADMKAKSGIRGQELANELGGMAPMIATGAVGPLAAAIPLAGAAAYSYEKGQGKPPAQALGAAALDMGMTGVGATAARLMGPKLLDIANLTFDKLKSYDSVAARAVQDFAQANGIPVDEVLNSALAWNKKLGKVIERRGKEGTDDLMPTVPRQNMSPIALDKEGTDDLMSIVARQNMSPKELANLGKKHNIESNLMAEAQGRHMNSILDSDMSSSYMEGLIGKYKHNVGGIDITDFKSLSKDIDKVLADALSITKRGEISNGPLAHMVDEDTGRLNLGALYRAADTIKMLGKFDDVGLATAMMGKNKVNTNAKGHIPMALKGVKGSETALGQVVNAASYAPPVALLVRAIKYMATRIPGKGRDIVTQRFIDDIAGGNLQIPTKNLESFMDDYLAKPVAN